MEQDDCLVEVPDEDSLDVTLGVGTLAVPLLAAATTRAFAG